MASLRHIRTAPYKVRTLYVVVGLPAAAFLYCTRFFSISSFPTTFFGQCKNTIGIPLSTHWLATTRETHTRRVFSHRCPFARCLPHMTTNRSSPYHHGTYDTERSACIQPAASLVPPTTPVTCSPTYAARYPCSPAHATCSPAACPTASAAVATIQ